MKLKNIIDKCKDIGHALWNRLLEGLGLEWIVKQNEDIEYEL